MPKLQRASAWVAVGSVLAAVKQRMTEVLPRTAVLAVRREEPMPPQGRQNRARRIALPPLVLAASLLTGCKSGTVTSQRELAPTGGAPPAVIYVADFGLWAENIRHEEGILSSRPGPIGRVGGRLSGASQDPEARARKLVELMAESLVKELTQAGFTATRLPPRTPLPAAGWLVRGVFTEVQEGNRLRRAMIGFGTGQTDVQVVVGIDNLSQGAPQPLYELETDARSGKTPGAAPTLVLGPYGAAARFVMAGKDLEKNVKQTAAQIAAQVTKRVAETK